MQQSLSAILFLPFLFEEFDIILISMKSVNQSHIRAASLVNETRLHWSQLVPALSVISGSSFEPVDV